MNLTELRADLTIAVGNPSGITSTTLDSCINKAYLRICDMFTFSQNTKRTTTNTVIGTQSYNLATNDTTVLGVWNKTHRYALDKVDAHSVNMYDDQSTVSPRRGRPRKYYRAESSIFIMPAPDAVYVLEFVTKQKVAKLVNTSDTPVLYEPWHDGIVLLARWYYFDQVAFDFPKAQYAWGVWQSWLQTKPSEVHQESVDLEQGADFMPITSRTGTDFDYD